MIRTVTVTTACVLSAVGVGFWLGRLGESTPLLPPPISEFERHRAARNLARAKRFLPAGKGLA